MRGLPTDDDLQRASEMMASHLTATPLIASPALAPQTSLKLESWQPTGSFKVRGALNALSRIDVPVVSASAGNHALGMAFAAQRLGRDVTLVVPENASPAKLAALRRFDGIELVLRGSRYDDAEEHALEIAASGSEYLSSYNDPRVIAGQSTIASELEPTLDGPATIVCPVGGGGMIAGIALRMRHSADVRVVGVEASASPAMREALRRGAIHPVAIGRTLADGMAGNIELGSATFDAVRDHSHELLEVTEPEIEAAMRFLAREHGLVTEGAGAVCVAAALAGKVTPHGRTILVVSGRNVALPTLVDVLSRA